MFLILALPVSSPSVFPKSTQIRMSRHQCIQHNPLLIPSHLSPLQLLTHCSAFLKYNIVHLFLPLFLLFFLASSLHGISFYQSRNNLPLLKLLISSLAMIVKQHLVSVVSWLKRNTWRPCSIFFKHGYHLAFKEKILLFLLLLNWVLFHSLWFCFSFPFFFFFFCLSPFSSALGSAFSTFYESDFKKK